MRIHDTDKRQNEWHALEEATGESTRSGAIDVAVRYYLRMHGGNHVAVDGRVPALMDRAVEEGSLTPDAIAEELDVEELPVEYQSEWEYGRG